jgi:hypothetical protein
MKICPIVIMHQKITFILFTHIRIYVLKILNFMQDVGALTHTTILNMISNFIKRLFSSGKHSGIIFRTLSIPGKALRVMCIQRLFLKPFHQSIFIYWLYHTSPYTSNIPYTGCFISRYLTISWFFDTNLFIRLLTWDWSSLRILDSSFGDLGLEQQSSMMVVSSVICLDMTDPCGISFVFRILSIGFFYLAYV